MKKYQLSIDDFDQKLLLGDLFRFVENIDTDPNVEMAITHESIVLGKVTLLETSYYADPLVHLGTDERIDRTIEKYEQNIKNSIEMEDAFELGELNDPSYDRNLFGDDFLWRDDEDDNVEDDDEGPDLPF